MNRMERNRARASQKAAGEDSLSSRLYSAGEVHRHNIRMTFVVILFVALAGMTVSLALIMGIAEIFAK